MNIRELRIVLAEAIEGTEFAGKVHFVGGSVRDLMLQRQTLDYDLTVELPDGGLRLAAFLHQKLGTLKPVSYPRFGTAYLQYRGDTMEFVMTRKEIYEPGNRNPKVSYGSLEEDIYRRDFTINTLLLSVSGGSLKDVTGLGLKDLIDGLIRTPVDPLQSFTDDPLRILRAIRFASLFGFRIEEHCWAAIRSKAELIRTLSGNRLTREFSQLMVSAPHHHSKAGQSLFSAAEKGYRLLEESGVLQVLDPELRERLKLLSRHSFSLNSRMIGDRFGIIEASRIRDMMQVARLAWYENPLLTGEQLLQFLEDEDL